MNYDYKPYDERQQLMQYRKLLEEIMTKGEDNPSPMVDGNTGEPLYTREIIGYDSIVFDVLENGAPIITERDISDFYKGAIGEIFGFMNGARTEAELRKFGCRFWGPWVTPAKCAKRGLEPGDIGYGSYGSVWANYPTAEGTYFNQWKEIDLQMRERPELKTHRITNWIPNYTIRNSNHQQRVTVCPCHGEIVFYIRPDGRLDMLMWQRSCDVILGLPSNWAEYTAVLLAMAETHNLRPGRFIHQIANAHIYSNTFEYAEELLSREPAPFPTLRTVNHHDRVWDYRKDDFELEDYHPKAKIKKIPVGV